MTDREDLQIGDETRVVITDPHHDRDKDPITQIDNKITYIKFPDGYTPEFGESIRVRIADVAEGNMIAVALMEETND